MKILAIDTSTSLASIAVAIDEQIVAESLLNTNRTLSARLVPEIERVLTTVDLSFADIDIFASSIGPGSFTGIRGGIATIQGLALSTGKPCVGYSSLALLSMNFSLSSKLICPMLDARKSEVYAALYDCSSFIPSSRITDSVLPVVAFLDLIANLTSEPVIFLGDGALRYRSQITENFGEQAVFAPFPLHISHSANGIMLAQHSKLIEPWQLLPLYLRASDADLMKKL